MTIEKPDGVLAFVVSEGGGLQPQAHMTVLQYIFSWACWACLACVLNECMSECMSEWHAGRAVVEMTIEKPDGALAFVVNEGGGLQPQARMTMVLEGYSAPITAGNFAKNVMQKLYVGKTLTVDFTGILIGKGTAEGTALAFISLQISQRNCDL